MGSILIAGNWVSLVIDYGITFTLRRRTTTRSPWLLVVILIHGLHLVLQGFHGGWSLLTGPYEIPSVLALSMAAVYAIVELATRDRRTGVFVLSLAFLFQYTAAMFLSKSASGAAETSVAQSGLGQLHVIPAMLAYTAMAFAGTYGLLCMMVQRGLKQHRIGLLFDRLPPLGMLGNMTWFALLTGFIFMTLTMVSAPLLLSAHKSAAPAGEFDLKILAMIVTGAVAWLIYGVAVFGKLFAKWPLSRISRVAVVGFLIVMLLLIVSGLLS
ncbi:MAG: hypothetical protein GWP05_00905 [Anaerolineaceae bacterium]|nr:hypothetical protein [Anaerolineaceae bacterium]